MEANLPADSASLSAQVVQVMPATPVTQANNLEEITPPNEESKTPETLLTEIVKKTSQALRDGEMLEIDGANILAIVHRAQARNDHAQSAATNSILLHAEMETLFLHSLAGLLNQVSVLSPDGQHQANELILKAGINFMRSLR